MRECLVFNHHSLPFDTEAKIDNQIVDFLKICIGAANAGIGTILVDETIDNRWFRVELKKNYYWQDWYNENKSRNNNKDALRAFHLIATQSPLFNSDDIEKEVELFDVIFDNSSDYTALRAAAWNDAPLVGFPTRFPWDTSPLSVIVHRLQPDNDQIEIATYTINNFFSHAFFINELQSLRKKIHARITSGRALLQKHGQLFPLITLCGKAREQLYQWSGTTTLLEQVKHCLMVLNDYSAKWNSGEISSYSAELLRKQGLRYRVSGESETTCNNPKLKNARTFWLPEGRKEFFEEHIKLANGFRIHFFPDTGSKKIYIGYIGPHLDLQ